MADKSAKEPNPGLMLLFLGFGAYLVVGAIVAILNGEWPVFLPPQFDFLSLLMGARVHPLGVYAAAVIVLIFGVIFCAAGVVYFLRRPRA